MSADRHARAREALARQILRDYTLSDVERAQETEALAQQIQVAVDAHLESLEHRRVPTPEASRPA